MKNMPFLFLVFAMVLLLAGCGGGGDTGGDGSGGGESSMTLSVWSEATPTTTHTYTGSLTTIPVFFGMLVSQPGYTQAIVEMSGPELQVSVCAKMTAGPGAYAIDSGLMCTGVQYVEFSTVTGTQIYGATSGTVTVSSYGAIGTPIVGTFESMVTNLTDTKRVWGSFSMKRML